jgi:CDP-diacylglycerol--serine O-phosphatidyltransferase
MSRPIRLPRIPDLLTTANLCCGTMSILLASQGQLTIACALVFLAALFDVFDGVAARALGGGTPLGAQLDSLADMVSFGLAPAMLIWFSYQIGLVQPMPDGTFLTLAKDDAPIWALPLAMTWIATASGWRLAKFNIDTRQTHGFLGLATPANGLFWTSIPLIIGSGAVFQGPGSEFLQRSMAFTPLITLLIAVLLGILMLSELPLPGLKFTHGGWKGNEVIFLLIGIGVVLAALYGILAVPLILIIYLFSPLWGKLFPKTT